MHPLCVVILVAVFVLVAVDGSRSLLSVRRSALGCRGSLHRRFALAKSDAFVANASLSSSEWKSAVFTRLSGLYSKIKEAAVPHSTATIEHLTNSTETLDVQPEPWTNQPGVASSTDAFDAERSFNYPPQPESQSAASVVLPALQEQDERPANFSLPSALDADLAKNGTSIVGKSASMLSRWVNWVAGKSNKASAISSDSASYSPIRTEANSLEIYLPNTSSSLFSLSSLKRALHSSGRLAVDFLSSKLTPQSAENSTRSPLRSLGRVESFAFDSQGKNRSEDVDGKTDERRVGLESAPQGKLYRTRPSPVEQFQAKSALVDLHMRVRDSQVGEDGNFDLADQQALLSLALSLSSLPGGSSLPHSPSDEGTISSESGKLEGESFALQPTPSSPTFQSSDVDSHSERTTTVFSDLLAEQMKLAVAAALAVRSRTDCQEYLRSFSLHPLYSAILHSSSTSSAITSSIDPVDALYAVCNLVPFHPLLADQLAQQEPLVQMLIQHAERLPRRFAFVLPLIDEETELRHERLQLASLSLLYHIIRSSSDSTLAQLQQNGRLKKVLLGILNTSPASSLERLRSFSSFFDRNDTNRGKAPSKRIEGLESQASEDRSGDAQLLKTNNDRLGQTSGVPEMDKHPPLGLVQLARVSSWGLGGVPWKARQSGQRGVRILSLDGGGTRGVLTIAFLKEIFQRVNALRSSRSSPMDEIHPFECFDMICGTSTGGIIAMLLGGQCHSIAQSEVLYDEFIEKIFATRSNLKLVTEQAAYDEKEFERILLQMTGDRLLLDTNVLDCPRVLCVSTKVNSNPPQATLWRNYNYPAGIKSRYAGSCRVSARTAIRATTAAPTFFTPVQWAGGLYVDGALVANNPTAIAVQEAKLLFPGVPIELVLSIGTGYFVNSKDNLKSLGWDLLVNQLIASTTDTEDVHGLLGDFLAKEKYYRFNPLLKENFAIDEKDRRLLASLKTLAASHMVELEKADPALYDGLFRTLAGVR